MKEKKLTDDTEVDVGMIVKALECCKQNEVENTCAYCSECPASDWDCEEDIMDCTVDLSQKAINLIHRLQSENEKLKTEREQRGDILQAVTNSARVLVSSPIGDLPLNINGLKKAVDCITEQKAEIERVKGFISTFETVIAEQQAQIEKKVEELYPDFMKEYTFAKNALKESLEREAELQKQVDELTEDLEKAYATERDNIRAEIANAGTSCHWCLQQAVKDTAKEILQEIFDEQFEIDVDIDENSKDDVVKVGKAVLTAIHEKIELMADRYGVEVE